MDKKEFHYSPESLWEDCKNIHQIKPLIHNITNYVVMNSTANALLAVGASPIMAHALEEIEELVGIANALVINIGTLDMPWIESMHLAGSLAKEKGIPIVLDPVGAGATKLRTTTAAQLLRELSPLIVRGNASEILALACEAGVMSCVNYNIAVAGAGGTTKGVESLHDSGTVKNIAIDLATECNCTVVVSGKTDIVTNGSSAFYIDGGDSLMTSVTGLGCTSSGLIGAFAAVNDNYLDAAINGMGAMAVAGLVAARKADGPGTLQLYFYDALYNLTEESVKKNVTIKDYQ